MLLNFRVERRVVVRPIQIRPMILLSLFYKGNFTFIKQLFPSQEQEIAMKESLKPEYNEKIETILRNMPSNNLRFTVLLMAAAKRFWATEKSLQAHFGLKNEFVDLVLACYHWYFLNTKKKHFFFLPEVKIFRTIGIYIRLICEGKM